MPFINIEFDALRGADALYRAHVRAILEQTDRLFAGLMIVQWAAAIAAAYWIAPRTWTGTLSQSHLHVWAALYLGGAITVFPVALALLRPGQMMTRHVVAVAQMLMSSLLIHLTGGRIETHFHVFGSLAFLSFYRDWRVLIPATIVVALDHYLRGVFWPQSVFGVLTASHWRWLEHAGWVAFEDVFLIGSCVRAHREMRSIAERTADLHASEARYRAVVDRAEGIFLADVHTMRILECNAAFRALLGIDAVTAAPITIYDIDAGSPEEIRGACQGLSSGAAVELERRYRRSDGAILDVTLNMSALSHGTSDVICGAVRDVTERRKTEEALRSSEAQLRQAQKMEAVGQLAGGIAHDFNNLLTGILGYAELALKQVAPGQRVHADIRQITRAGQSAAALTHQLLTFSRRQVMHLQVIDLNAVISGVDRMLQRLIGEPVQMVLALDPALRLVEADAGQVEQVVVNLAVNARDAMPNGGQLSLETANVDIGETLASEYGVAPGSYVSLTVTDTGCGMTPEVQARLFEPFFTTKESGKGTGLGLSTAYGIVTRIGGAISVRSEVGVGTTFRVVLPAAQRAVPRQRAPQLAASGAPASECVLLVEDDSVVRALAERTLQDAGYTVFEASSPAEALRISARQTVIDVIVSDVVMPDLSGPALVERVGAHHPSARILFMSGYTDDALASHKLDALNAGFLPKPFTPDTLLKAVREVLDHPADEARAAVTCT